MHAKLINLAYRADCAGFDERPLRALFDELCGGKKGCDPRCVLEVNEYFFTVDGVPHLSCFVKWREPDGSPNATEPAAQLRSAPRRAKPLRVNVAPRASVAPPSKSTPRAKSTAKARSLAQALSSAAAERREPESELSAAEAELYGTLRAWRRTKSESLGVPAFRVLSNRQLTAIARERPRDSDAFARLPGIGALRAENYAAEVLAMVAAVGRRSVAGIDAAGIT